MPRELPYNIIVGILADFKQTTSAHIYIHDMGDFCGILGAARTRFPFKIWHKQSGPPPFTTIYWQICLPWPAITDSTHAATLQSLFMAFHERVFFLKNRHSLFFCNYLIFKGHSVYQQFFFANSLKCRNSILLPLFHGTKCMLKVHTAIFCTPSI